MEMISKIWAEQLTEMGYGTGHGAEPESESGMNLDRLNIIIGANNSGKSRLIRELFSILDNQVTISDRKYKKDNEKLFSAINERISHGFTNTHIDIEDCEKILEEKLISYSELSRIAALMNGLYSDIKNSYGNNILSSHYKNLESKIKNDDIKYYKDYSVVIKRIYIPMIRGLRPLSDAQEKDVYLERTMKDYFPQNTYNYRDITTGHSLYEIIMKSLLGEPNDRKRIRDYERN